MAQATVEDDNGEKKAPQKPNKKAVPKQIVIKRTERNKRKHITTISHLDLFDVDLKKAAKLFANRFACGSSVTKSPSLMKDEIVVQGDVQYDVIQVIVSNFPQIKESDIVIVEPKPKKGEAAASE
jgi:density-regulated protein DRP1